MVDHGVNIDICVCTFKRPRMLATLLRSLGNQSNTELFNSSIIIVDNDVENVS